MDELRSPGRASFRATIACALAAGITAAGWAGCGGGGGDDGAVAPVAETSETPARAEEPAAREGRDARKEPNRKRGDDRESPRPGTRSPEGPASKPLGGLLANPNLPPEARRRLKQIRRRLDRRGGGERPFAPDGGRGDGLPEDWQRQPGRDGPAGFGGELGRAGE